MLLQCNVMCNHFTQDNEQRRKKQCETMRNEAKRGKTMQFPPQKEYVYQHFFPVNNKKNKCFGLQINGI